jgi:hypothetical protein
MSDYEDRRFKPVSEKLRREVQVLLTDEMYLAVLEKCNDENVRASQWIREAIRQRLDREQKQPEQAEVA